MCMSAGISALAGLVVVVIVIALNSRIMSWNKTLQKKAMERSDARVKALSEIINGIKVSLCREEEG